MGTLYDITKEIMQLMQMMEEEPENPVIIDTLEALSGELDVKAEGYCKVIKEFEAKAATIETEINRLTIKKAVIKNSIERLKNALFTAMQATNTPKINGDLFMIYLKKNRISLDKVPDKLPKKYLIKQEPKIDRTLLLQDIKDGVKVKGVTIKQTQSLIIK